MSDLKDLHRLYKDLVLADPGVDTGLNGILWDAYAVLLKETSCEEIERFLREKPFVIQRVRQGARRAGWAIYQQPVVLGLYYLAEKNWYAFKAWWPLPLSAISPICSDMGIASGYS